MAHTFHFTAGDPALGVVHTLRKGEEAERTRVGAPWRRTLSPHVSSRPTGCVDGPLRPPA